MSGRRIGIYGGTFDPPHLGHLVVAVNVRWSLRLDEVLLVVANQPWQKVGTRDITPAAIRLEMVEASVRGTPGLVASDLEVRRGGRSYTADTLAEIRAAEPDAELFVIVGRDAAAGLDRWDRIERIRADATIVVVDRPDATGTGVGDAREYPATVSEGRGVVHLSVPHLEISSTDLRSRVEDGRPLDFLVAEGAVSILRRHGLYGGPR